MILTVNRKIKETKSAEDTQNLGCRRSCGMDGQADARCWDFLWLPVNLGDRCLLVAHRQELIQLIQQHTHKRISNTTRWPSGFWQDEVHPSVRPHNLSANIQLLFICPTLFKVGHRLTLPSQTQDVLLLLIALRIEGVSSSFVATVRSFKL